MMAMKLALTVLVAAAIAAASVSRPFGRFATDVLLALCIVMIGIGVAIVLDTKPRPPSDPSSGLPWSPL